MVIPEKFGAAQIDGVATPFAFSYAADTTRKELGAFSGVVWRDLLMIENKEQSKLTQDNKDYGPMGRGKRYWCIKTDLSAETGEIYAWADEVRIDRGGSLALLHHRDGETLVNLMFVPGSWWGIYAASMLDGSAIAVQTWPGEVIPGP